MAFEVSIYKADGMSGVGIRRMREQAVKLAATLIDKEALRLAPPIYAAINHLLYGDDPRITDYDLETRINYACNLLGNLMEGGRRWCVVITEVPDSRMPIIRDLRWVT